MNSLMLGVSLRSSSTFFFSLVLDLLGFGGFSLFSGFVVFEKIGNSFLTSGFISTFSGFGVQLRLVSLVFLLEQAGVEFYFLGLLGFAVLSHAVYFLGSGFACILILSCCTSVYFVVL